jgi:aldehyde:ferredoxin oxidoreductase
MILCKFLRGVFEDYYGESAEMLRLVTGWDVTPDELQETAARIVSAKKWFNILSGWQPAEDTLPARFFEESPENDPQAVLTRGRLHELVKAYNQTRGWSPEGWMDETVRTRLGLPGCGVAEQLQGPSCTETERTKSETA